MSDQDQASYEARYLAARQAHIDRLGVGDLVAEIERQYTARRDAEEGLAMARWALSERLASDAGYPLGTVVHYRETMTTGTEGRKRRMRITAARVEPSGVIFDGLLVRSDDLEPFENYQEGCCLADEIFAVLAPRVTP